MYYIYNSSALKLVIETSRKIIDCYYVYNINKCLFPLLKLFVLRCIFIEGHQCAIDNGEL
jgi:hypothetical protein